MIMSLPFASLRNPSSHAKQLREVGLVGAKFARSQIMCKLCNNVSKTVQLSIVNAFNMQHLSATCAALQTGHCAITPQAWRIENSCFLLDDKID